MEFKHEIKGNTLALKLTGDLIGEEGKGFRYLLHGLNAERILVAATAAGLGQAALRRAADYARERVVFDRPIGMNQGIQLPLAQRWVELQAAELLYRKAAELDPNDGGVKFPTIATRTPVYTRLGNPVVGVTVRKACARDFFGRSRPPAGVDRMARHVDT